MSSKVAKFELLYLRFAMSSVCALLPKTLRNLGIKNALINIRICFKFMQNTGCKYHNINTGTGLKILI